MIYLIREMTTYRKSMVELICVNNEINEEQ